MRAEVLRLDGGSALLSPERGGLERNVLRDDEGLDSKRSVRVEVLTATAEAGGASGITEQEQ